MSTGYQIKDQEALHYLTLQIVDWIDLFSRKVYRDIVLESIRYQQNKGLQVFGYVIMSNHVHLICNSPEGKLSDTIRDLKKFPRLLPYFLLPRLPVGIHSSFH